MANFIDCLKERIRWTSIAPSCKSCKYFKNKSGESLCDVDSIELFKTNDNSICGLWKCGLSVDTDNKVIKNPFPEQNLTSTLKYEE